jgi:hypothetical protein
MMGDGRQWTEDRGKVEGPGALLQALGPDQRSGLEKGD